MVLVDLGKCFVVVVEIRVVVAVILEVLLNLVVESVLVHMERFQA